MATTSDDYVFCGCGSTEPPVKTLKQRVEDRIPFMRTHGLLRCPACDAGSLFKAGETPESMRRAIDTIQRQQQQRYR
ncbi:MAG: hypothetical protein ACQSGP_12540 [Frankia sp.]